MTEDRKFFDEIDIYHLLTDMWTDVLQATNGQYITDEQLPRLEMLDGSIQSDPKADDGWMDLGVRGGVLQVWLREDCCQVRATDRTLLANTHEGQEEVLAWVVSQWKRAFLWACDEYVIDNTDYSGKAQWGRTDSCLTRRSGRLGPGRYGDGRY